MLIEDKGISFTVGHYSGESRAISAGAFGQWSVALRENRLTQVMDGPTGTPIEIYAFDATGNRTALTNAGLTTAYTYAPGSHRLDKVGSTARSYDAAGNTTKIGGNARQFVYDTSGRMTQVKSGGVVTRQYEYNAKGEQVHAYLDDSNAYFAYDEAGHLLGEYNTDGTPKQQILWFGDLPVGVLQGAGASQQLHYIEPDHLGTPRVIIDGQRNVPIWEWSLLGEAFGNSSPNQDPDQDGNAFTFDLRFPGQRYDSATGLNYNYFRDYDPSTGRYVESDPIGLLAGPSTYSYVGGRPLVYKDPSGLVHWSGTVVNVGAAAIIGGTFYRYDLTSECVGGKQGHAIVYATGPTLGVEIKGAPPVGGAKSSVDFDDDLNYVNPNVFNGWFSTYSTGIALGPIGYGCSAVQLGGNGSSLASSMNYGAVSVGCGREIGLDASLSTTAGSATVMSSSIKNCDKCKQ